MIGDRIARRLVALLVIPLVACSGSGGNARPGAGPAASVFPPSTLVGRSVETDAVAGTVTISGGEVTITAGGFFTLQTTLALHSNGVAYLRPSDSDMSAFAVGPFVFWNGNRSVGWPAGTTRLNYVPEGSLAGDAAALAGMDDVVARFNAFSLGNINGAGVSFARMPAIDSGAANCRVRVDPNDPDITSRGVSAWTRWLISGGVISSCDIILRSREESRQFALVAHEMIHGLGLFHTSPSASGMTIMNPAIADRSDRGALDRLPRVVAVNIAMAFRRRPNTLLSGNTEDERGASTASAPAIVSGVH